MTRRDQSSGTATIGVYHVELIRRNQPLGLDDANQPIEMWDAQLWVFTDEGRLVFDLPDSVADNWPMNVPDTAIDAVALAIQKASSAVMDAVRVEIQLGSAIEDMKRHGQLGQKRHARDREIAELIHRAIEGRDHVSYAKATLVYEQLSDDDEEDEL